MAVEQEGRKEVRACMSAEVVEAVQLLRAREAELGRAANEATAALADEVDDAI